MDPGERYIVYGEIARGGMASVHLGRLVGPAGFARIVAVKRLHSAFAGDPEIAPLLLDEGRLASRIRHPNVVPTLDVLQTNGELLMIMEYVHGESLARLLRACTERGLRISPALAANIMAGVLHGLHAAHEATDPTGRKLELVHRDVSPQNILVGADGVPRIFDFGIAKALGRSQSTGDGELKGKLAYMSPEQLSGFVTRQTDIYSASVCLWEMLTLRRLFGAEDRAANVGAIIAGRVTSPREIVDGISPELDAIVMRGLAKDVNRRFTTAREMALALERAEVVLPASAVADWVQRVAADTLAQRAELVERVERLPSKPELMTTGASPTDDVHTVSMIVASDYAVESTRRRSLRRNRRYVAGFFALLGLVAASTALLVALRGAPRAAAPFPPVASERPSDFGNVTSTSAEGVESAPAPAPAPIPAPPSSILSVDPSSEPKPRTPVRPRSPARPSCSPPYREVLVDGHLRRVPKPECL